MAATRPGIHTWPRNGSARDRIAELQRRSDADAVTGGGLRPEALAELHLATEEPTVTGEELRSQTDELASARAALEAQRERYQELFESAPIPDLVTDRSAGSGRPTGRRRPARGRAAVLAGRPLAA